jgi:hypothetical protein
MSQCPSCEQQRQLLSHYCQLRDAAHCAFREGRFETASRLYYDAMVKSRALINTTQLSVTAVDAVLEASANCMHFANHPDAATLSYQLKQSEQALMHLLSKPLPDNFRQYVLSAYIDIMQRLRTHLVRNDFSASANAYQAHLQSVLSGENGRCRVLH